MRKEIRTCDKYRILVVDDSQFSVELIFELLQGYDYDLHSAQDGRIALEMLMNEEFDLVLLDVMMPYMDGYEVCKIIKKTPEISNTPVIFITAKNDNANIIKGFEAGAVDYVTKPFHTKELIMRVKTHIELVRSKKEIELARDLAQESARTKGEFLANMSHEIRTPIYGITGMIDLLKATKLTPMQEEYTDIMSSSVETLLTQINDILDFSKLEAGELHFEPSRFDLVRNLENIISIIRKQAGEKGLLVESHIDSDLPSELIGDPTRLNQVVFNLASNAIKFTNKGKITINVFFREEINDYITLLFEIIDTGIGISDENMNKLFMTFSQVDASTTRIYGGAGLGLVISKKLTKLMGGTIGVESEPESGSKFWFTCKLAKIGTDEEQLQEIDDSEKEIKKIKILLAEDNPVNVKVVQFFLYRLGQEVDIAENGVIAVDKYKNGGYDLILMDINMPEMDGYAATRLIRQIEKEEGDDKKIRIIAMTANAMTGDREKCLECGMDDYISKPFRPKEMERVLSNNINQNTLNHA